MGCKYVPEELKKAARKELGAASEAALKELEEKFNGRFKAETWTFTMADGAVVTKKVFVES